MMYTPEYFLDKAIEQYAIADKFVQEGFGPGTVHEERNNARRLGNKYENAAWLMERMGWNMAENFGPFLSINPKAGMKVRIKKGSPISSTGKANKRNATSRAYTVTLHSVDPGYITDYPVEYIIEHNGRLEFTAFRNASVRWAGAGGYWCWTDINNIEIVE